MSADANGAKLLKPILGLLVIGHDRELGKAEDRAFQQCVKVDPPWSVIGTSDLSQSAPQSLLDAHYAEPYRAGWLQCQASAKRGMPLQQQSHVVGVEEIMEDNMACGLTLGSRFPGGVSRSVKL